MMEKPGWHAVTHCVDGLPVVLTPCAMHRAIKATQGLIKQEHYQCVL